MIPADASVRKENLQEVKMGGVIDSGGPDQPPARRSPPGARRLVQAVLCGGICLLAALWPGSTPWTSDEPHLIAAALRANQAGRLATLGLHGSFGVAYGPLPTQIYQLL